MNKNKNKCSNSKIIKQKGFTYPYREPGFLPYLSFQLITWASLRLVKATIYFFYQIKYKFPPEIPLQHTQINVLANFWAYHSPTKLTHKLSHVWRLSDCISLRSLIESLTKSTILHPTVWKTYFRAALEGYKGEMRKNDLLLFLQRKSSFCL